MINSEPNGAHNMCISDMPEFVDKNNVLSIEETVPLAEAIEVMRERNIGSILALKKGKLSGIFTERDVLIKVANQVTDYKKVKLKDVMTADPFTANKNDSIESCMRRMSQGRFRHMPVVDDKNNVIGLLSQGDFVAFTMSDAWKRFTEQAKAGIFNHYQPFLILVSVIIYTIILLSFLTH